MGTTINFIGTDYSIPAVGEVGWGQDVTNYLLAISTGVLTRSGGQFVLTNEVDFGLTYGLRAAYLRSQASNPASAGRIRLGNTDSVQWRNAANSANLVLGVLSSNNRLAYQSLELIDSSSSQTLKGKTLSSATIIGGTISSATLLNVTISGVTISTVTGLTVDGNTVLGNSSSDTIDTKARFISDLVPSTDSSRDLGTASLQWAEAHIDTVFVDVVRAGNGTVSAPGISFESATNNGFYYNTNSLQVAVNGVRNAGFNYLSSSTQSLTFTIPNNGLYLITALSTTGEFRFSGGNSSVLGGSIRLYGQSHASRASDIGFYSGPTIVAEYDASGGQWIFRDQVSIDDNVFINNNITLGNSSSDTINTIARFTNDLVPSTDSSRDLGTASLQWAEAHIDSVYGDSFLVSDGTAASPSMRFESEATGFYLNSAGIIGMSIGGTERLQLSQNTISWPSNNGFINSTGSVYINTDSNGNDTTSVFQIGTNRTGSSGGTLWFGLDSSGNATFNGNVSVTGAVLASAGSVSAPSISFSADTNTGIYNKAANTLSLTANGEDLVDFTYNAGPNLAFQPNSADGTYLRNGIDNGLMSISASTGSAAGRNLIFYGQNHATLANLFQIRAGSTVQFQIDSTGICTLGASGSTQTHTVNGNGLNLVGQDAANLTINATSGASGAIITLNGGSTAFDKYIRYQDNGTTQFCVGIDDSAANAYKVSASTFLGTNDYLTITTAGICTLGAAGTNVTQVINGNVQINQGTSFVTITRGSTNSAGLQIYSTETSGDAFIHLRSPVSTTESRILMETDNSGTATQMSAGLYRETAYRIVRGSNLNANIDFAVDASTGALTLGTGTNQHALNTATSTSATAGSNGAVPAQVDGYITITINGATKKIPYFNT